MRKTNNDKHFFIGNTKLPELASSLDSIYRKVDTEGLGEGTIQELKAEIESVSKRFGISPKAAVLLAAILEHSGGNGCDDDDLSGYVGCSNIQFFGFREALRELEEQSIITRRFGRGNRYAVTRETEKTIEKGSDFVPLRRTGLSTDELFTRFRLAISDYKHDLFDGDRLLEDMSSLIGENQQLEFCRKASAVLANPKISDTERRFFLYLCHRYVSCGDESVPIENLLAFTGFMEDELRIRRSLSNERSDLQMSGLVTFGGDEGLQDTDSLALSDEVKRTFFTEATLSRPAAASHRDLIPCSAIKRKELFYDGNVAEQMDTLASLLEPGNFKGIQERLCEMGMRRGFAVLFSGAAGCGKPAGAYELARRSGRDIFAVDMSELKSKWVGDSEKIVKGVFTTYRQMCKTRDVAPILLFNEADAIFSKRMENPQDSVDQMMNAIQNICLDAIENLDGILIATTNLAANFCDDAFARRFIFKVEFGKPEVTTRAKIWRSMIESLSEEDSLVLASRYDFSGGNIENIARKAAVGYVLSGKKAGIEALVKYCDEETLSSAKKGRRIGFGA